MLHCQPDSTGSESGLLARVSEPCEAILHEVERRSSVTLADPRVWLLGPHGIAMTLR
jgi:hypothetical protein